MTRISRMLIGATIGAFAAHAAWAQTTETRAIFGAGPSNSCGAWTKARQSKAAKARAANMTLTHWLIVAVIILASPTAQLQNNA